MRDLPIYFQEEISGPVVEKSDKNLDFLKKNSKIRKKIPFDSLSCPYGLNFPFPEIDIISEGFLKSCRLGKSVGIGGIRKPRAADCFVKRAIAVFNVNKLFWTMTDDKI